MAAWIAWASSDLWFIALYAPVVLVFWRDARAEVQLHPTRLVVRNPFQTVSWAREEIAGFEFRPGIAWFSGNPKGPVAVHRSGRAVSLWALRRLMAVTGPPDPDARRYVEELNRWLARELDVSEDAAGTC